MKEFRDYIRTYAILKNFVWEYVKNDNDRARLKCHDKECNWLCYAKQKRNEATIVMKTLRAEHTYDGDPSGKNSLANSDWVAKQLEEDVRVHHQSYTVRDIVIKCWKSFTPSISVLPPHQFRPPGRPSKNRKRGFDEAERQGKKQRMYRKCGLTSHNTRTCKGAPSTSGTPSTSTRGRGRGTSTSASTSSTPSTSTRGRGRGSGTSGRVSGTSTRGRGTRESMVEMNMRPGRLRLKHEESGSGETIRVRFIMTGSGTVPYMDLVLQSESVKRKFYEANSMVKVNNTVSCLGIQNGGLNPRTVVVLGGHQLENYILEFDLVSSKLGFNSSLLQMNTSRSHSRF
ncbi:hypothetical protein LguiB_014278 [Lonicera macranthoides]